MTAREIRIPQEPIIRPVQVQQASDQLTPQYLDSIINNQNEHAQVRKQAAEMKRNLFPQSVEEPMVTKKLIKKVAAPQVEVSEADFLSETPVIQQQQIQPAFLTTPVLPQALEEEEVIIQAPPQPKVSRPISKQIPTLDIKPVANSEFDSFLSEFKNNLFNDEFSILSNPSTKVQLRSMTVSEYKFLTKQFEVYQRSLESMNKETVDISREVDLRESVLTNAIDNVLQRCITNNVRIYDLTLFDWIYAMIAVRAISRGTEENLRIICTNKKCKKEIRIGVLEVMRGLEANKDKFIVNPVGIVTVNETTSLYLGIPTRGDLVEAQKIFIGDPDSSLSFVNIAMYIRAYIQANTANLLSPQQRFTLINVLQYDVIKKIKDSVNKNLDSFYKCFGEIKCKECGEVTEIDISDFILFFYDF